MNSTFKVVFNKARGALMVVNEVTSSVQAKGTKTVVATAVAAIIAGVAGTAGATGANYYLDAEGNITITGGATPAITSDKVYTSETGRETSDKYNNAALTANDTLHFLGTNGVLNIVSTKDGAASGATGVTLGAIEVSAIAANKASAIINLTTYDQAYANQAKLMLGAAGENGAIGTGNNQTVVINFANEGTVPASGTAAASVIGTNNATGDLTIGTDDEADYPSSVTINVAQGAAAQITAGTTSGTLTLDNVVLNNEGALNLVGKTAVVFNSSYTGTTNGSLLVEGNTILSKDLTDTVVLVGDKTHLTEAEAKTVKTQIKGTLDVVGKDAALNATTLYVNGTVNVGSAFVPENIVEDDPGTADVDESEQSTPAVAAVAGAISAEAATLGDGDTSTTVTVNDLGTLDAKKLTLKKATLTVGGHDDELGAVTGEELVVVGSDNTITNGGKVTFTSLNITGNEANSGSALTINGANGIASVGAVTLAGTRVAGESAALEVVATAYGDLTKGEYNVIATTVDVGENSTLTLTSGAVKAGAVTIGEKGVLAGTAGVLDITGGP